MAENGLTRVILLNRLVSLSTSRAPPDQIPPTLAGRELIQILQHRREANVAIEFLGATDDEDEAVRLRNGAGHSFIRLSQIRVSLAGDYAYATLLFEHVDDTVRSFPVVNTMTYAGREIGGDPSEWGSTAAHMVVRFPVESYDDGNYRCAVEPHSPITRSLMQTFLSRQLRRYASSVELSFDATVQGKRDRRPKQVPYRFHPKLELWADVGRGMNLVGGKGTVLSHMLFTKRSEVQSIHHGTTLSHEEVVADVDIKVSAKQGPEDADARRSWLADVRKFFEQKGYKAKLYYRHAGGGTLSGGLHHSIEGAADIFMCPKELIALTLPPKRWQPDINDEIASKMKDLVDKDQLWERRK
ncbi:hypothetical protein [Chelatococcus reniformis]|uniref:Uncharacterized protein n=1 Tax=Chelatococcus reniformis TaxID=1494448 RepID=A0A916XQ04_9HYPH|nr:hypothetical protein [Chelatococcus reniformis]GGC90123.1 hypothetical protein GCM10010994_54950 [Chelatococcus reniformis]